jgi:hypothetical protein
MRFELNLAIDQRENGVIFAKTNVISRMNLGTALPHYDGPCQD